MTERPEQPDWLKEIEAFFEWYTDLFGNQFYLQEEVEEPAVPSATHAAPTPAKPKTPRVRKEHPLTPLQKFFQEIKDCQKCALGKTRTKFVFGVGNEHADIMFVGEAPGRDEDLQGEPFVGRAGQLLTRMLEHIHLKREDVYIANILKCRPPNNRDPLPEEVRECIPYLHRQIEMIQPKVLVALGRVAAQNLLNTKQSLSQLRGKVMEYRGIPMIITYHPAAVLRNMNLLDVALEDFRFIARFVKEVVDKPKNS
ncbi:MAG: uracil-DNA glycosylase [Calditrichaeota bacterium]|nr:uracil-DNA glycosylase [Calditrichota bacterium]